MSIQHTPQTASKPRRHWGKEILSLLSMLLCAAVLVFLFQSFVGQIIRVDGTSMTDTLQDGEYLFVSTSEGAFERGDVVICQFPGRISGRFSLGGTWTVSIHELFVKRLIALPGDTVMIRAGKVYVNDVPTDDPPRMASPPRDYPRRTLGKDEYFVMGDNRLSSHDSRSGDVGPISLSMIRGKVKCVIWPLNAIRSIP